MEEKSRFKRRLTLSIIVILMILSGRFVISYFLSGSISGDASIDKGFQSVIDGIYLNPELVDEKPDMLVDKQKFLESLNQLLPPKTIFQKFGKGYHEFRFELGITSDGKLGSIQIKKETEGPLPSTIGDFLGSQRFVQALSEIKYKPALLDNKNVASILVMTLFIAFDEEGNVTYPWFMRTFTSTRKVEFFDKSLQSKESDVRSQADVMPQMIGGPEALSNKIVYPAIARKAGIEGKVIVAVVVDENGNVIGSQIIKGLTAGLDDAAVNALKQIKFRPGTIKGKPVKVKVVIPIVYTLSK